MKFSMKKNHIQHIVLNVNASESTILYLWLYYKHHAMRSKLSNLVVIIIAGSRARIASGQDLPQVEDHSVVSIADLND